MYRTCAIAAPLLNLVCRQKGILRNKLLPCFGRRSSKRPGGWIVTLALYESTVVQSSTVLTVISSSTGFVTESFLCSTELQVSPNYMPAEVYGASVPVRSVPIHIWTSILATAYLLHLTHAFQSPAFFSEKSKYADESLEVATNSPSRQNTSPPSILTHDNNGVGVGYSHTKAISSRRGFLRDVIGLGLGVATGSVSTPRLADAFSGEWFKLLYTSSIII